MLVIKQGGASLPPCGAKRYAHWTRDEGLELGRWEERLLEGRIELVQLLVPVPEGNWG